jgi:hypothetical protein
MTVARIGKVVADEAHGARNGSAAVEADDAGGLLAAMLQRVQAQRREGAASGWPKMPNTPHSSRSLSSSLPKLNSEIRRRLADWSSSGLPFDCLPRLLQNCQEAAIRLLAGHVLDTADRSAAMHWS